MDSAETMRSDAAFERARLARDRRFDGRFFVGVRTTGIYCRPICPAVAPKRENVRFFPSAAAAGDAGFRPCLRCRPECAPGTPAWNGTSTTVRRGLRLIADGALDDGDIEQLAERLGVTSRHLRRLFTQHIGASPLAVAHTQRLHFAKRLISDTNLPMAQIAVAAGFGSIRRFNDAFRKSYGRAPRELRREFSMPDARDDVLRVNLAYRTPFDWRGLLGFFAGRTTPGVEHIAGDTYLRTVDFDGRACVVECTHDEHKASVVMKLHGASTDALLQLVQRARDLLDLDAPVDEIDVTLRSDPLLAPLAKTHPGMRVPGAWDGFEITIRAILGQQVSVQAARTIAGRIVDRYGERAELPASFRGSPHADRLGRLFPTPERLMRARLNNIGIPTSRAATIRGIAAAVAQGDVGFDPAQDIDAFRQRLVRIRGIGDWTAQYVAMRALKDPDAFPASDLGVLKALAADNAGRPSARDALVRAETWRPWRAYATLLLWSSLAGSGG